MSGVVVLILYLFVSFFGFDDMSKLLLLFFNVFIVFALCSCGYVFLVLCSVVVFFLLFVVLIF